MRRPATDDRANAPLERGEELARLLGRLEAVESGRGGRAVVIEGAAGMGKSTLVGAFATAIGTRARVLRAAGQELERDLPFVTVRHLLEPALVAADVRHRLLVGAAAPVRSWFDPAGDDVPAPLTMLRALFWTVAGLASERPLVLIVDDAPDADPATVQFLAHLTVGLADLPVLLVLTGRPDGWRGDSQLVALQRLADGVVELAPLSVDAVRTLAVQRLDADPDPEFLEACRAVTGGNPFYLGELLREIAALGTAPTSANASWVADLGVPALLRGSLLRLATMPSGTVDLLRAAAILGDGIGLARAARVAGLDPRRAGPIADRLSAAGILRPGTDLTFTHAILRTAVLADLPDHGRADLHRRAAEHLRDVGADAPTVASHLIRSEPLDEAWAAAVLRREGERLLASGATTQAAEMLGAALAERPEDADADLYAALGAARAESGEPGGADLLERAVAMTVDPVTRAMRGLKLTLFQARAGRNGSAIRTLEQVIAAVPEDSEPGLLARATRFLYARYAADLHDDALRHRSDLTRLVDGPPTPARAALRAVLASDSSHHGRRDETVALLQPIAGPTLVAVTELDAQPVFVAMEALLTVELDEQFDSLVELMIEESLRRGSSVDLVTCEHFRALAAHLRGRPVEAEEEALQSLASATWSGWPVGASASYALASLGAMEAGRLDDARVDLARAEDLTGGVGKPGALVHLARGRVQLADGDLSGAAASFEAAGELLRPTRSLAPGLLDWAEAAVATRLALGDRSTAAALADAQLTLARVVAGPRALARTLRAAAACHFDPALLHEALELVAEDRGLERVRVLFELGSLERRAGRPAVARRYLDQAWDLAQRLGATVTATRVREELRVAGGRPRRGFVSGPEALTAGERRVARLAAEGRSNVEIAQTLFVTTKTVEKHLGATYRKLEVSSRAQLPKALAADPGG